MSTEASQGVILDVLPKNGSPMRFKELAEACKKRGLSRDALARHLDQLEKAGTIIRESIPIKTGAGTQYRLRLPTPRFETAKENEGWEKFIEESARKIKEAIERADAAYAQVASDTSRLSEAKETTCQANEDIGRTVHSAVATIGALILAVLRDYSLEDDRDAAAHYLKIATDSYLPNLIRDIAKLTPPGMHFDYPAMGVAYVGLFGHEAIEEYVERMRKDAGCSLKSGSEDK